MSEFNEPWQFGPHSGPIPNFRLFGGIGDGIKDIYLGVGSVDSAERTLETMHRICACVNFCRNMPTDWLQKHVASSDQTSFGKFRADTRLWIQEIRE